MDFLTLLVTDSQPAALNVRQLTLAAADGSALPPYEAGAHVEIALPDGETRPYSLVDLDGTAAAPRAYVLGVLLEPESRGGSQYMHGLKPGDTLCVTPPRASFSLTKAPGPSLLIAGGIGVTPILSMARALKDQGRPYQMVYAARSAAGMAFADHLQALHGEALTLHQDDTKGGPLPLKPLIDAAEPGAQLYICGPRPMIEAARETAIAAGLPHDRIHIELFETAAPQSGDQRFEVELASTGQVFTIPADRTIIQVLEAEGIDVMYDCQRGDCGICQTDVLDGVPDHRDVVLTDAERAAGRIMQICVSRALTPRLKLDL
ncbi:MAG: PDR/VanB family oxidoreductase [Pararhodobacter sp.]